MGRTKKAYYQLAAYGVIVIVLMALSSAVFLERVFPIDTTVLQTIRPLNHPVMDQIMVAITQLGNPHFTVPAFFIVVALLWWQRQRTDAIMFSVNCFGGAVLSTYLKIFFGKVRPALWNSPIEEVTFSYPSGHALGSVVFYGFLAYLLGVRWPEYRKWFYVGAIALSLLIGFTRLYLGVHWPTDLLGGYAIGVLWTSFCVEFLKKRRALEI